MTRDFPGYLRTSSASENTVYPRLTKLANRILSLSVLCRTVSGIGLRSLMSRGLSRPPSVRSGAAGRKTGSLQNREKRKPDERIGSDRLRQMTTVFQTH